jgi:ankyrin repeat protein
MLRIFRNHVKLDLHPYVCAVEKCTAPVELFVTSKEWLSHMRKRHFTQWSCRISTHKIPEHFQSEGDFIEHMKIDHPERFREEALPFIAQRSSHTQSHIFDTCPFCDSIGTEPEIHVAEHLRELALLSWPPTDLDKDGESSCNPREGDEDSVATSVRSSKSDSRASKLSFEDTFNEHDENWGIPGSALLEYDFLGQHWGLIQPGDVGRSSRCVIAESDSSEETKNLEEAVNTRKRSLLYEDQPEARQWQEGPAQRTYDNIVVRDNARAHYHGSAHHYSDRVQTTETTLHGSATRSEILQSLKFDEMSDRFSAINPASAKTCHWLVEREEYRAWHDTAKSSDHNGFLWIKGKPGAGKSTLMKWAFTHAQKFCGDDKLICFFFNARGEGLERSTEGMYRSLLAQLLEKVPRLQSVLDKQIQKDSWPVEMLIDLFREAVMALGDDGLICYIDALNECSETEICNMIEVFEELTESAIAESVNFRVCFSSRHYPRISIDTCLELVLEGQEGHEDDIAAYIQKRLKVSARSKSEMAMEIQKRASGVFLWVCLVIRILNEDIDRGDASKIKTRLKEIPDGLHQLFQDIITQGTREDTHLIPTLQWIMFTQRPLTCRELYHAITYTPNNGLGLVSEHEEFSRETAEKFLINSTKGLAETTRGNQPKVQFIHESVRDYLRTTGFRNLAPHLAENLPGLSHEFLKQRCLEFVSEELCRHLSLPATLPKTQSAEAEELRARSREDLPFLEYAISNVLYHAEHACACQVSQYDFIEAFPLATWTSLHNLHERYMVRRYTSTVTLPYILADKGTMHLLSTELRHRDPDFSMSQERHRTLLGAAIYGRHIEVVKLVLEYGAIRHCSASELGRLLRLAARKRASEMLRLLIEVGKPLVSMKLLEPVLIEHSGEGNMEIVKLLLDKGADANAQDGQYGNALQAASARGHAEIAQLLLDKGADVNAQCGQYGNALQAASARGHAEIAQLLLDKGADVNAQCGQYGNALQAALARGHAKTAQLLLDIGANINA